MVRGDLIVGFLRVLRDDLSPEGVPAEAVAANTKGSAGLALRGLGAQGGSGMGYTVLAWTRDGETWHRDRHTDKFFEPDPKVGAWDHAMAWVGSAVPVGDDVYLYYAGYRWGHKYHHSVDRQLGRGQDAARPLRRAAGGRARGTMTTRRWYLGGDALLLNVDAQRGRVRRQDHRPTVASTIPGFRFDDCRADHQRLARRTRDHGSSPSPPPRHHR